MGNTSLWRGTGANASFPTLKEDIEVDVAIIGGGITGITAAQLLSQAGKRVAVLEARTVGEGTTGNSTGNLYVGVDNYLSRIRSKWGADIANRVARSRQEAISAIEETIRTHGISCGFQRCSHYFLATDATQLELLDQEELAMREAGISLTRHEKIPIALPVQEAMEVPDQAQFHPLTYVQRLAQAIVSESCQIYEHSPVESIDEKKGIVTTKRADVTAEYIIMATHTPKGFHLLQTELAAYREYGIAAPLLDIHSAPLAGIFWTLDDPGHSVRLWEEEGQTFLIVIGEKHKTGQQEEQDYYQRVEQFARTHFKLGELAYQWSAQHYHPADELPYIGPLHNNLYVAAGFTTNGLVYGPLAAKIITDAIQGVENEAGYLYRPNRFTPAKSARAFMEENANVAKQYLRDYLAPAELKTLEALPVGEGKLVEIEGSKHAVSRTESGDWRVLSAVCPHLGGIVHWNPLERTWDCPCHGSRFDEEGEVLEGPSLHRLERYLTKEPQ